MRKLPTELYKRVADKTHLGWGYTGGSKDYSKLNLYLYYWGIRDNDKSHHYLSDVVVSFNIDDVELAEQAMEYLNSVGDIDSLDHAKWLYEDWRTSTVDDEVDVQGLIETITKLITKVEAAYHEHADAEDAHRVQRKQLKAKLTKLEGVLSAL